MVEPFLAAGRTVIRRNGFLCVAGFAFGTVQIPKTSPTVCLLVLHTVKFSRHDPAICTAYLLGLPLALLGKSELRIVLPHVLPRLTHHVLVHEDRKLLLTRRHVDRVELWLAQ
jgi:hypothetical protein